MTSLTTDEKSKVLADLACIVGADRKASTPTYTDAVLAKMLPAFCCEDLTPAVCVALFDALVTETSELGRFNATYRELDRAQLNVDHYIRCLVHGAADLGATA